MPVYNPNLYEQLIIDLKSTLKNASVEDYLFDLRPKASDLYKALSSPSVNVDYSDHDIQIAYMLRYLPGYWEQINEAFEHIMMRSQWPDTMTEMLNSRPWEAMKFDKKGKEDFNIALFCCGPAPEIIGIVKFFESMSGIKDLYKNINVHLFDLKIASWKFARDTFVLNSSAMEKLTSLNFKFFEHQFDLTSPSLSVELDSEFSKQYFHICHFQNCLNEIDHTTSRDRLIKNIYAISRLLIKSGFFIFTDRNTISSAKECCNFISDSLDSNASFDAAELISGSYEYIDHSPITDIMRTLFWQSPNYKNHSDQRLIPTSKNQRFIQLIRKNLN